MLLNVLLFVFGIISGIIIGATVAGLFICWNTANNPEFRDMMFSLRMWRSKK